jgi:uncharacterized protein YcbK (DUF882 family)
MAMYMLSQNFTYEELTASTALDRYNKTHDFKIKNRPSSAQVKNLRTLCSLYLQPLRDNYGPIRINSGFRSELVNNLVGGSKTSLHLWGRAADIHCPSWDLAFRYAGFFLERFSKNGVGFDELFVCRRKSTGSIWIHLGMPNNGLSAAARLKVNFMEYE